MKAAKFEKGGKYVHITKLNLSFHVEHTLGKYRRNIEKKAGKVSEIML